MKVIILFTVAALSFGKELSCTHLKKYPNGKPWTQSVLDEQGRMVEYKEWYDNGVLAKEIWFENGLEVAAKVYRKTGQIYINQVIKNGRSYGLPGSKACFRVGEDGLVR